MHLVTNTTGTTYELRLSLVTMGDQTILEHYDRFALASKADYYALTLGDLTTSTCMLGSILASQCCLMDP